MTALFIVIPAQAGIHFITILDPCFRRDDRKKYGIR